MQVINNLKAPSLFLRIAIAAAYLWEVADRWGLLGANGKPHVGWGDWAHFIAYAKQVMSFLPEAWVIPFAALATIAEATLGLMLLFGIFTRRAAVGSGILSLLFAVAMTISFGIESPLGYSVFTLSAASFMLATVPSYSYSIDRYLCRNDIHLSADMYGGDNLVDIIR